MTPMTSPPLAVVPRCVRSLVRTVGAVMVMAVVVVGCSAPPPPAPEPTGDAREAAWRIAAGDQDMDRTMALIYSKALNAHDIPAVVVDGESTLEDYVEGSAESDAVDLFVARTMDLARVVAPVAYSELTTPEGSAEVEPAASSDELTELIEDHLEDAELLTPAEAVMSSALVITSVQQAEWGIEADGDLTMEALEENCSDLRLGVRSGLPSVGEALEQLYGCTPSEIVTGSEDALISRVVDGELDAALLARTHPGLEDHALVVLQDSQRAFPQDQYAPVVDAALAEGVPDVLGEISEALTSESVVLLGRLVDGPDALTPDEAAEYWLVENGFLAEPDGWG